MCTLAVNEIAAAPFTLHDDIVMAEIGAHFIGVIVDCSRMWREKSDEKHDGAIMCIKTLINLFSCSDVYAGAEQHGCGQPHSTSSVHYTFHFTCFAGETHPKRGDVIYIGV